MKTLRRILQFLFGLQTLTLVITIAASLWLPLIFQSSQLEPDAQDGAVQFTATLAIACIWMLVPAIAWWKLRRGKRDARWWAVAASVLCLPIPASGILVHALRIAHSWTVFASILHIPQQLLELAVGMTGLAVFLPSRASEPPAAEPKLERVEGDGTSKYWEYALQIFVVAALVAAFVKWRNWGPAHGLAMPSFPAGLALLFLALFVEICCHEVGHFVAGSLCGQKLRQFHVGPFRWSVRNGKWTFEFLSRLSLGGSVVLVPQTLEDFRRRKVIGLAGGPLASLTLSVGALVILLNTKNAFWYLFAMITTVSSISFLANLIPQKTRLFYSDGAQLYQVLSNGPWGKVHLALAMAATSLLTDIRPRDWDISLINEAAGFLKTGIQGMVLRLFASHYYLDSGNIAEAVANMNAAASLFTAQAISKPADFYVEFVFVNALYARDFPAAEAWWLKLQALKGIDYDADYWRARASILWLGGELEDARQAWERGNEKAQRLPACGIYNFSRWQLAEMRKVLDQGARVDFQTGGAVEPTVSKPNVVNPVGV
jgi:hypothetical protein